MEGLRGDCDGEREKKKAKVDAIQTQTKKFTSSDLAPTKYADSGLRPNLKPTREDQEATNKEVIQEASCDRRKGKENSVPTVATPSRLPLVKLKAKSDVTSAFLEDGRWKTAFLPSITHALYMSSRTLSNIFPSTRLYSSTPLGVVHCFDTLEEIQNFFSAPEYAGKTDAIKKYVAWALRGDGPGYNAKPTPSDCKVKGGEVGYIEPDGTFQSTIMTAIARKYIKHAEQSVFEPSISPKNPPKGLYALIAAAVERAFASHRKGVYKKPDPFSDDNNSAAIKFFKEKGDELGERRWKLVLNDILKDHEDDASEGEGDISIVSNYRETFFIPKSPVKAQQGRA
ncbi:hypothetical protein CPB84DRAFT_1783666 [Gymnopilus junonius]|uniref:Uncharacterized protein n=1 Tax=Gymnopilus junonius TaxID=109634 RepID=A0A9P5TLB3_GYMJU|nr:hypothetical protein CPB84DRAFT_1783666 [Gymnopilus junonius]